MIAMQKRPVPGEEVELSADSPIALIVEDDPDGARIAAGMLRMLGYRSRIAVDATGALLALSEGVPSLVVLDVCLPTMDGLGFAKVTHRIEGMRGVPIVAASAVYPENGPVARALAAEGVVSYLSKPFTLTGLREAIDAARSHSMKVGPAPVPSMGEGLRAVSDSDVRRKARQAATVPPQAPAAPARTERREQGLPAAPLPPRPAAEATPGDPRRARQGRQTALDEGDPSLDFPIAEAQEADPSEATDASQSVAEVYAQATVGTRRLMVVVDGCTKSSMVLRSPDEPIGKGEIVRLEVNHRMAIEDTMSEVLIRLLGNVVAEEDVGDGWRCQVRVTAARPVEAHDHLIRYFERFRR